MKILLYIIPFIPSIIYILYFVIKGRARGREEILVGIRQGNWLRVALVTIFICVAMLVLAGLQAGEYKGDKYIPAKFENGVFTPNRIEK
jgi:hypothetical protein